MKGLVVALLTVGLAACAGMPVASPLQLERTGWRAVQIVGQAPVFGSEPVVLFEDGRVSGYTGCNSFGAPYEVRGSGIAVGREVTITLAACREPVATQQRLLLEALSSARGIRMDGARLVISGPGGELVLEPIPPDEKGERPFGIVT